MDFLGWWVGLSPWLRYGVALALLVASIPLWLCGLIRTSMAVGALGMALFFFAGPSESEKRGYHD